MQFNYPVGYGLVTHSNGSGYGDSYSYMDALVWAVTELMLGRGEIAFG